MRDQLTYINHLNQSIVLGPAEILLNANKVRDYKWEYDTLFNSIYGFKKKVKTFPLPIAIYSNSKNDIANDMFELFEKDVLAETPGKLVCGNYYLSCYIIGKATSDFVINRYMKIELTVATDKPNWVKTDKFMFRINNSNLTEEGLGYPYDYPYDFVSPMSIQSFNNDDFVDTEFEMIIYGAVSNPAVTIGQNTYRVNCDVGANEYLTINSKEKTIILTTSRGVKVNKFAYRDTSLGKIFKKIPPGTQKVVLTTECNLDITLLKERSEPKWI